MFVTFNIQVERSELQNTSVDFPSRTVDSYKVAVETLKTTDENVVNGLKFDSIFNSLKYFHVAQSGLPPYIAHDLFEGIIAVYLAILLAHFVKKKCFSYTQLNRRIAQFKYLGPDAGSAPFQICKKGSKLGGQAAENWCLLRFLPVIIDSQDPVWQLTLKLKELVELVCAPRITTAQIAYLSVLIPEYLEPRKEMFPGNKLKLKHYYMLHYPHSF